MAGLREAARQRLADAGGRAGDERHRRPGLLGVRHVAAPGVPGIVTPARESGYRRPAMTICVPCVLDIEASGFGRHSYPIEVGYALPDGRARCMLIRPAPGWTHWDPEAERIHGIARETLQRHGQPIEAVADRLNDDLEGRTVYCNGWAHDYPWLGALYEAAGRAPRFRLESVVRLLDETALAALDALHRRARRELGLVRHRASNDARALQRALAQLPPA
jgi:hypothetical protein